ncbi:aminodeoxychorismate synthase component I [Streptomyces sp. NPDC046876]|uniref:aminodeoxychorismate synthase component I n=1 Tax=Streptomyces sp. NPDC046876 TaxID=3155616 RepID=UPI0033E96A50
MTYTLLVDNHDSYTYNLFQLIAEVNGREPLVLRNDDPRWEDLDLGAFDNAVVSPGPGHPGRRRDFGHSVLPLYHPDLPVLGVCLGHQGIGLHTGAPVTPAPEPRHGHLARIRHDGTGLFAGVPQDFTAVRYHSLRLSEPLPAGLEATAWAEDGVVMAIRSTERPHWGVQFHPESIASEHGRTLLANFRDLARAHRSSRRIPPAQPQPQPQPQPQSPAAPSAARADTGWRVHVRTLPAAVDTERTFTALYADSAHAFWLDSSMTAPGLSRFSFLGDAAGPHSEVLTYRVGDGSVLVEPAQGAPYREPGTVFDVLDARLAARRVEAPDLPFDLPGGYVGYFGYELKADCGAPNRHTAATPDAVWQFADRLIVVDHQEDRTYLIALAPDTPEDAQEAEAWLQHTHAALRAPTASAAPDRPAAAVPVAASPADFLGRGPVQYVRDIETCQEQLRAGESYEICLTDTLEISPPADDLAYYLRLRRINPAPYAALLRHPGLTVASASPERFLRIDADGWVESKPIKGTAPRSSDPVLDEQLRDELAASPKTRAENLMIVDLLRNDLGTVCEVGSVSVPRFMATESYATVHQLVSTIRGRLREDTGTIGCVRACFPGGSMTGAPKLRTMEIIDSLEDAARGVYSGALGYLGLGGAADLSIVIRTATILPDRMTVGAGGAIVLDSDPHAELDEMLLKASVPLRALEQAPQRQPQAI